MLGSEALVRQSAGLGGAGPTECWAWRRCLSKAQGSEGSKALGVEARGSEVLGVEALGVEALGVEALG